MIQSLLPWWDTLHAWWSEHPKYAFQVVINSTSSVDQMVSNFEKATPTPPMSDKQALDENTLKVIGLAQLPSLQESYMSSSSPLQSPIPSLSFVGAQHPLIDSYTPQANVVLNSLLIMDPSLPSFNPSLPPPSSLDSSPLHSDVPFPNVTFMLDVEDMPAITLSSGPSARSTPGPKSIGESSSRLSSHSSGPKG